VRAAQDLQADVEKVSGVKPAFTQADAGSGSTAVLIGTAGKSPLIDGLVQAGKIDLSALANKWEMFVVQVVDQPMAGVDKALVIAGSDKRGTIFGIYELSEEMGVSPWHYWADVPPQKKAELYVTPGAHTLGEPAVKYRGFFINDEAPALTDWYAMAFSSTGTGFNSKFYVKVFELLLRMKGNYLWPAMWGKSFNVDDPENPRLADEYGVVMGTSHHEPMTRSEQEWYDAGHSADDWSYSTNAAALRTFWQGGIERMGERDTLVTVGMRGSGDIPNPDQGIPLLESIVTDQRKILKDVTGKEPAQIPQVWTLYKEVQSFYDGGMKVPDDVTLNFADDNWGNIRRLPSANSARAGGYGVYYHFDYVGGPRSYRWMNTNPIPRVWEQMRRAESLGATQVWVVNVGDIKPMEFPLHFFMDLAWDPKSWTPGRLADYPRRWAKAQFGEAHAAEIGELVSKYLKFNGRRKPELIDANTYSLENFREADTVVDEFNALAAQAEALDAMLPADQKDAFYQLVLHPILACANLNEMYVSQAKNSRYASQGRASTNAMGTRVGTLFDNDAKLTARWDGIAAGKWKHMMKQTHIGYTGWDNPATQVRPSTKTLNATGSGFGVAVEGSTQAVTSGSATLPEVSVYYPDEVRKIEVFNRGTGTVDFTAASDAAYVTVTPASGNLSADATLAVSVSDWAQVPEGDSQATITITGTGGSVNVKLPLNKPASPLAKDVVGFVETNGYVSLDASHYTNKVDQGGVGWSIAPDLGKTGHAVHIVPDDAASVTPGGQAPRLEYDMYLTEAGQVQVRVYLSPSLPVRGTHYKYAVSFDDGQAQSVDMHDGLPSNFTDTAPVWEGWVSDNIIVKSSNLTAKAGKNTLKLWMVDAGVVVQKIVVSHSTPPASYLGPPARLPLNFKVNEVIPDMGDPGNPGGTGGATSNGGGDSASGGGATNPGAGGPNNGGAGNVGGSSNPNGTGSVGTGGGGGAAPGPVGGNTNPGGGTTPGQAAGCGCRTASDGNPSGWASLGALSALAAALSRRRSPRRAAL
jgi:MYXO-CTERM domain-containing protein